MGPFLGGGLNEQVFSYQYERRSLPRGGASKSGLLGFGGSN
jgi:hypothetical protein